MSEVILGEMPTLSRLYLTAASTAARHKLGVGQQTEQLPAVRHTVDGVHIAPDRVSGFQQLMHGTVRDTLPSVFLHSVAFPVAMSVMTRQDFPLPLLGMVHLANRVNHLRPVHFAEPLTVTAWAEGLRGHHAGTQVELHTRIDAGGETVWEGVSDYLAKAVYLPGLDKAMRPERTDFIPPQPTARWRLGPEAGREYAGVSGDFNPIHLSAVSAKMLGLKRSIAHGMYLASRVLTSVEATASEPFSWRIDFAAPVFLPATVAVRIHDTERDGSWEASEFTGWGERSHRLHFTGCVNTLAG
jgi:acyl dehydratase